MKKITLIFLIIAVVLVAGFVLAQAVNFPSSFTMVLNDLPSKQSSNQLVFNCPYDENIEHRETLVTSYNLDTREVVAEVKYWTQNRRCAGSWRVNATLAVAGNQQQLVANFIDEVNSQFLAEAQSNRQHADRSSSVISRGGN